LLCSSGGGWQGFWRIFIGGIIWGENYLDKLHITYSSLLTLLFQPEVDFKAFPIDPEFRSSVLSASD
jgi:hypothetical protein